MLTLRWQVALRTHISSLVVGIVPMLGAFVTGSLKCVNTSENAAEVYPSILMMILKDFTDITRAKGIQFFWPDFVAILQKTHKTQDFVSSINIHLMKRNKCTERWTHTYAWDTMYTILLLCSVSYASQQWSPTTLLRVDRTEWHFSLTICA